MGSGFMECKNIIRCVDGPPEAARQGDDVHVVGDER